jgi:cytoskeletal protein RodZ
MASSRLDDPPAAAVEVCKTKGADHGATSATELEGDSTTATAGAATATTSATTTMTTAGSVGKGKRGRPAADMEEKAADMEEKVQDKAGRKKIGVYGLQFSVFVWSIFLFVR